MESSFYFSWICLVFLSFVSRGVYGQDDLMSCYIRAEAHYVLGDPTKGKFYSFTFERPMTTDRPHLDPCMINCMLQPVCAAVLFYKDPAMDGEEPGGDGEVALGDGGGAGTGGDTAVPEPKRCLSVITDEAMRLEIMFGDVSDLYIKRGDKRCRPGDTKSDNGNQGNMQQTTTPILLGHYSDKSSYGDTIREMFSGGRGSRFSTRKGRYKKPKMELNALNFLWGHQIFAHIHHNTNGRHPTKEDEESTTSPLPTMKADVPGGLGFYNYIDGHEVYTSTSPGAEEPMGKEVQGYGDGHLGDDGGRAGDAEGLVAAGDEDDDTGDGGAMEMASVVDGDGNGDALGGGGGDVAPDDDDDDGDGPTSDNSNGDSPVAKGYTGQIHVDISPGNSAHIRYNTDTPRSHASPKVGSAGHGSRYTSREPRADARLQNEVLSYILAQNQNNNDDEINNRMAGEPSTTTPRPSLPPQTDPSTTTPPLPTAPPAGSAPEDGMATESCDTDAIAFSATLTSILSMTPTQESSTIIFDDASLNVCAAYDVTTGVFHAPSAGSYVFTVDIRTPRGTLASVEIVHNENVVHSVWANGRNTGDNGVGSGTVALGLETGDEVYTRLLYDSGYTYVMKNVSRFTGYKI